MSTGYYLLDKPNPNGPHYYRTRRSRLRLIVMHVTAGLEDLDTNDDHSAENTARYAATTDRKVSWHSGSDTDSWLRLLPEEYTAFHCQGYNSSAYGHEISKRHTDWSVMSEAWISKTLVQAAACLKPVAWRHGIPLRLLTKAQADAGMAGFTSHGWLDPSRRTDPGLVRSRDTFPWGRFFSLFDPPATVEEEDTMHPTYQAPDGKIFICLGRELKHMTPGQYHEGVEKKLVKPAVPVSNEWLAQFVVV